MDGKKRALDALLDMLGQMDKQRLSGKVDTDNLASAEEMTKQHPLKSDSPVSHEHIEPKSEGDKPDPASKDDHGVNSPDTDDEEELRKLYGSLK